MDKRSYIEWLCKLRGYPRKIHCGGVYAYLVGEQALANDYVAPIYTYRDGYSVVFADDWKQQIKKIETKMCPRCKNEEIALKDKFCKICGLALEENIT